jgi:hypothetical protein
MQVSGLPQHELDQLGLHFHLLNDFRLMISPEEMQVHARQHIFHAQGNSPARTRPDYFASTPHMRPVQKLAHQVSSALLASACSHATSLSKAETEQGGASRRIAGPHIP